MLESALAYFWCPVLDGSRKKAPISSSGALQCPHVFPELEIANNRSYSHTLGPKRNSICIPGAQVLLPCDIQVTRQTCRSSALGSLLGDL